MPSPKIRKKPTNKRCQKGYPCKTTCINREKNCRNPLKWQAKDLAGWLKLQEERLAVTNQKRSRAGLTPATMNDQGYITADRTRLSSSRSIPSLESSFIDADRLGKKYQTREEREDFQRRLNEVNAEIGAIVDQRFPDGDSSPVTPKGKFVPPPAKRGSIHNMPDLTKKGRIAPPPKKDNQAIAKPKDLPSPTTPISLDELRDMHKRMATGAITADEIKNNWERFKASESAIKAELGKMTIAQLSKEFPQVRRPNNKAQHINFSLETLRDRFNPGSSIQYDPFSKDSKAKAHDEVVKKWTDELIAQKVEERKARQESLKKAIGNPETLSEFDTFVMYRGEDALSPEQRVRYDELQAEAGRKLRSRMEEAKKEAYKPEVKESASTDSGIDVTLHQTKHSKQGHDLHVVKIGDRVERSVYNDLLREAKSLGGYYSAYSRDGAIPGFQFRSVDNAKTFMEKAQAKLGKDVTPINKKGEAIAQPTESTESSPSEPNKPRSNPVAKKLKGMAEKLREQGEEELSRDRRTNTVKRAGEAARGIENAQEKIRFAKTMDNLATAIEGNDVKFIDKITTKSDIEQLDNLVDRAGWNAYQKWLKENPDASYQQREDKKNSPTTTEDIIHAEYPYVSLWGTNLNGLVSEIKDVPGLKAISQRLSKHIIYSPAHHVKGDPNDRTIYFKSPQELSDIRKIVKTMRAKAGNKKMYGSEGMLEDSLKNYDRLQRMGITNEVELRAALREFMQYRDGSSIQVNPIKAAELALVGKKFDGYFPTPKGLADRLVEEAGIEPGMKVLEPSAGKGSLLDAIRDRVGTDGIKLTAIEPVTELANLIKAKGYSVEQGDFLQHSGEYDRIVMNPPFEKQQDIDHVRHAFELLKPGGRLVAITSESPFFTQNKKASDFRDFVDTYGISEKLPEGSFKNSDRSTGVATRIVILDKPNVPKKENQAIKSSELTREYIASVVPKYMRDSVENLMGLRNLIGDDKMKSDRLESDLRKVKDELKGNKAVFDFLKKESPSDMSIHDVAKTIEVYESALNHYEKNLASKNNPNPIDPPVEGTTQAIAPLKELAKLRIDSEPNESSYPVTESIEQILTSSVLPPGVKRKDGILLLDRKYSDLELEVKKKEILRKNGKFPLLADTDWVKSGTGRTFSLAKLNIKDREKGSGVTFDLEKDVVVIKSGQSYSVFVRNKQPKPTQQISFVSQVDVGTDKVAFPRHLDNYIYLNNTFDPAKGWGVAADDGKPLTRPDGTEYRFNDRQLAERFSRNVTTQIRKMLASENLFEQRNGSIGRGRKTYAEIEALSQQTPYDYIKGYSADLAEDFKANAEKSGAYWKDKRTGYSFKLDEAIVRDLRSLDFARQVMGLPDHVTPDGKPVPVEKTAPDTPRAIAATETEKMSEEYAFARKSAVPNAGEDLLGSARHIRNRWRSLADAEREGTAQELVTKKHLLKNEPTKLMETIDDAHALSHLAAYLSLNAFPPVPFKPEDYKRSPLMRASGTEVELREQYYNAFKKIKAIAEDQARLTTDPFAVTKAISDAALSELRRLRAETNQYNPVANGLVKLYNVTRSRIFYGANDVGGKLNDFGKRIKNAYGDDGLRTLDQVREHASRIIEGKSFNESFNTVASKSGQFNPALAYVKTATRKGGRMIDASTVESGTNFLMKNIGLRGIQYGNSVTDNERVHHLQKSAEALADLADITGFPDSAISLGGMLGLAIGARGKGGASAHYERSTKVINLTRNSGVGTLSHEWGHALDNYIAGGGTEYLSDRAYLSKYANDPVAKAMSEVNKAIVDSGFEKRLREVVRQHVREGKLSDGKAEYWRSTIEVFARTFERYVQHKLREVGRDNTYLTGLGGDYPLWPSPEEIAAIAPAMDKLLAEIRAKHFNL